MTAKITQPASNVPQRSQLIVRYDDNGFELVRRTDSVVRRASFDERADLSRIISQPAKPLAESQVVAR